HGVQSVAELVEQLPVIIVDPGLLVPLGHRAQTDLVDIAERDNLAMPRGVSRVTLALAANADASDVQRVVRSDAASQAVAVRDQDSEARDRSPKQERPSVRGRTH